MYMYMYTAHCIRPKERFNFSDILHTNPHLQCSRAQSPSFGGSARVGLGIKEEGKVSAFSDQDHSTQNLEDYNW